MEQDIDPERFRRDPGHADYMPAITEDTATTPDANMADPGSRP